MVAGLPAEVVKAIPGKIRYQTYNLNDDYREHYLIHNFNSSPRNYCEAIKEMTVAKVIDILDELIDIVINKEYP